MWSMIKRFEIELLKEAEEFLNQLDDRSKKKIISNMYKAKYLVDASLFKKLQHGIWEFRTIHLRRHYRLLAFWHQSQHSVKVIITHGLIKKSDKLSLQEINKSLKIKSDYLKKYS